MIFVKVAMIIYKEDGPTFRLVIPPLPKAREALVARLPTSHNYTLLPNTLSYPTVRLGITTNFGFNVGGLLTQPTTHTQRPMSSLRPVHMWPLALEINTIGP